MNTPETKRLSDTVSSAGSMTLFLLFAVCCLVIISAAASAYGRVAENYDNSFNSAAAVKYVTNKIRACEKAEILSDDSILLTNQGYSTVIYYRDGAVYERLFGDGQTPVCEGGEEMFGAESFALSEEDGLITVTAADGGSSFTACCGGGN